MTKISLLNYTQAFGPRALFRQVSVDFDWENTSDSAGIVGLMGPSGSGKTTLLRQILNARYSTPISGLSIAPEGLVIGFVPQSPILFANMGISANARMFALVGRYKSRFDEKLFSRLVDALRLEAVLREAKGVEYLSGGEMQRLMLLRTLSVRPDLLLLDEPATGLDAAVRDTFLVDFCETLRQMRVAALYVGHHWEEISYVSDNIAYLVTERDVTGSTSVIKIPIASRQRFEEEPPTIDAFQSVYGPGCSIWPAASEGPRFKLRPPLESELNLSAFIACFPALKMEKTRSSFARWGSYRLALNYDTPSYLESVAQPAWIYRSGSFLCRSGVASDPAITDALRATNSTSPNLSNLGGPIWTHQNNL